MDVQIGDTVLVFDVYGTASAAIVTSIGDNLTIGCASFMHDGTLRPIKQLLHKSAVMQGFLGNFWDFRPSQKEPPAPKYPEKVWFTDEQFSKFHDWSKPIVKAAWDKTIQEESVEIKPRQYFENKPALGTFEWALVALKNGHKVRRFGWSDKALAVKCEYNFLRFTDNDVFPDDSNDLLATDWVLA